MYTYQKFLAEYSKDAAAAVHAVVTDHRGSAEYVMAIEADEYDRQKNRGIMSFQKTMKTVLGHPEAIAHLSGGAAESLRPDGSMFVELQAVIGSTCELGFSRVGCEWI